MPIGGAVGASAPLAPEVEPGLTASAVSHSEFNTSQVMPTNTDLRNMYEHKVAPEQTNYQQMSEVSFLIDNRDRSWTDMTNLALEVELRIKKTEAENFEDAEYRAAFFENNLFHSLFEKVELEIQGNTVRTEGNYALRAYIDAVTSYTRPILQDMRVLEGFYETKEGADLALGATTNANTKAASPSIYARQEELSRSSRLVSLLGRFRTDLTEQGKMLIPGTALRVKLVKNKVNFYTRTAAAATIHPVEIKSMALHVSRSTLQDSVDAHYRRALAARQFASYPVHRKTVSQVIIPKAVNVSIPRFITGMIPRRVIVGFVDNGALTGDTTKNPYNFQSMHIREMWLSYDGKEYPTRHYETDFTAAVAARTNIRAYAEMRKVLLPTEGLEGEPYLTYERWLKGHTLFAFDLTPDQSGATGTFYKTVRRSGDVALELRLSEAPGANDPTMSAVVLCEYDNQIDIRAVDGQPILDW